MALHLDVMITTVPLSKLHPRMNRCQRKFQSKPPVSIPSQPDVTLNGNGTQTVSWHCPGFRTSTPCSFSCFKKFFIFSVDLLSRRTHLRTKDLPSTITLNGKLSTQCTVNLHSATLWGGGTSVCSTMPIPGSSMIDLKNKDKLTLTICV